MQELPKTYDPSLFESGINQKWKEANIFTPQKQGGEPFAMVFPPANVTGVLHLGHALTVAIQDIIIRFCRMQGFRTLYIPGTDHAAIATQAKVEAELYKKEKKTRRDFSREEFLKLVEQYAANSQATILDQLKQLGASVDWSRLAYTLDEKRTLAVRTAFMLLFKQGLIYRGSRLVNWDPKLQTNVSDDEIDWKEETTNFYYLKYGPFIIGTARPETKFGDKYVVMHPRDPRYSAYEHGQKIEVEWINGHVGATIIKDEVVDMEFGTGVMTITPAHDATDYEIAKRHGLDIEPVIDLRGCLLPIAGEFSGQHIGKARSAIIEKLRSKGLFERVEANYTHRIATNNRGGGIIEPQIREQWFIAVDKLFRLAHSEITGIPSGTEVTLKQLVRHVVESGQIKIIPAHFAKTYFHWIDNLHDWCISRQIVFGHQIPVWYRNGETHCGLAAPDGEGWQQDPDTLDTWFSSGLWTFSTLGWPEDTPDLKLYHPNAVMETGYDILFFWVARMILMSCSLLGQIPFRTVYLHGLVRDAERQKMSKSKGNIIDPLDVMRKYGTDALRFALVYANSGGTDMAFMEDRVKGMKYFANKLWNISRFVITNTLAKDDRDQVLVGKPIVAVTAADQQITEKLKAVITETTSHLENFRFNEAAQAIYQFIWHELADKYIETSKAQLKDDALAENTQRLLLHCLKQSLKLLHPFMPFVTEYIWGLLQTNTLLATEQWPES
ncbi:MAG: valine--tRNA ligase [Candidatus Portnoybacteria bacterium RIFCSPLOWO2_02_FULL_39_11]|uniref:Valine--tRNA ligase n=1 Tax=Candidatus Portnoybacteria bacterium RIFCSPLOWO2_02_FULL_39_11 TaxID=1802001 RepID=A0A1G2FT40_9BACT|nr:MAG: valine--tRNA ligase [Candidatus Portnoybacteria bacterium RIFCSPLOWO2_02_FULL_39_11]